MEENYQHKLKDFVLAITTQKPQIIALQEVNQTTYKVEIPQKMFNGYYPCSENITIREDNHIFNTVKLLREKGIYYYWTWLPIKCGYNKYDEGIGLMSISPIVETKTIIVSTIDDYNNWKTRKILGIRTESAPNEWFFSVHYGWWNDKEEPFQEQWKRTLSSLPKAEKLWLMGDFNNSAQVRNEGYDLIESYGWRDSYNIAKVRDNGITVGQVIDGWRGKTTSTDGMRIDFIWCNKNTNISSSEVIFNGKNFPVVSDHYGVMIDYEKN